MASPTERHESDEERPQIGPPERSAAGLTAVAWSLRHIGRQVGLRRGTRTLLQLNQPDGFDCPGLRLAGARPDPHALEFCENGAKAVAEEATTATRRPGLLRRPPGRRPAGSRATTGSASRAASPSRCGSPPAPTHYQPIGWDAAPAIASPTGCAAYDRRPGGLLHVGAHQQRGRLRLPAVRAVASAPTTSPTARTCATSRAASPSPRRSASARAPSPSTTSTRPSCSSSSARTRAPTTRGCSSRSRRRSGAGPRSSPSTRCPRPGCCGSATRSARAGLLGRGTELADLFLPIRVGGDLALFQLVNHLLLARDARPTHRRSTTPFLARPLRRARRLAAHLPELDPAALLRRHRPRRGRRRAPASTSWRRAIGSSCAGRWASPSTGAPWRRSARSSTRCSSAGQHRPPGRGAVPGARPQQRAGRPHDGHLRATQRRPSSTRSATRVRLRPAAGAAATTPSTPSGRWRAGRRRRVRRPWAATSWPPRPTPPSPPPRSRGARLTVQISTKLNRSHLVTGRGGAAPAVPRPHRARRAPAVASSSSPSRTR